MIFAYNKGYKDAGTALLEGIKTKTGETDGFAALLMLIELTSERMNISATTLLGELLRASNEIDEEVAEANRLKLVRAPETYDPDTNGAAPIPE